MKAVFKVEVLFLLIALAAVIGHAQGLPSGSVDGLIRINGGEVVGSAWVQLERLGFPVQEQFSTEGRFMFLNVPYGRYTVSVRVPGQASVSQEISVPGAARLVVEIDTRTKNGATSTTSIFELRAPRSAQRQYQYGRDRSRKGDCSTALKYFAEAVRLYANYAEAYNAMGNCHVQLRHPENAEEAFKKAVALTSSVYPALNLADVYIKQGRLEDADAVLSQAIRRDPAQGDGYYGLALLRYSQHRLDEAERLACQAHDHSKHVEDVHLLLAQIHQQERRMDLVAGDLQDYVREAKPNETRDRIRKILADARVHPSKERKGN